LAAGRRGVTGVHCADSERPALHRHGSSPCPRPPRAAVSVRALLLCWSVFSSCSLQACSCRRGCAKPSKIALCQPAKRATAQHQAWRAPAPYRSAPCTEVGTPAKRQQAAHMRQKHSQAPHLLAAGGLPAPVLRPSGRRAVGGGAAAQGRASIASAHLLAAHDGPCYVAQHGSALAGSGVLRPPTSLSTGAAATKGRTLVLPCSRACSAPLRSGLACK